MGPWHLCSKLLHSLVEGLVIVLDLVETQRSKGVVSGSCRVCYHINKKEHENEPVVVDVKAVQMGIYSVYAKGGTYEHFV